MATLLEETTTLTAKQDILNTLALLYNERSHDAFHEAIEEFVEQTFDCRLVDMQEYAGLESDAIERNEYETKYQDLHAVCVKITDKLRLLADDIEP